MSFQDEGLHLGFLWAEPVPVTDARLTDLLYAATAAAWLTSEQEAGSDVVTCIRAVPALVAEVRRLRASVAATEHEGGAHGR